LIQKAEAALSKQALWNPSDPDRAAGAAKLGG